MATSRRHQSSPSPTRERRGEAAGRSLVAAWHASGLRQAEFARRRGVSAQRLSYWRLRLSGSSAAPPAFVEVPVPAPALTRELVPSPGAIGGEVVIEAGGDLRVRLPAGTSVEVVAGVVSALHGGRPC